MRWTIQRAIQHPRFAILAVRQHHNTSNAPSNTIPRRKKKSNNHISLKASWVCCYRNAPWETLLFYFFTYVLEYLWRAAQHTNTDDDDLNNDSTKQVCTIVTPGVVTRLSRVGGPKLYTTSKLSVTWSTRQLHMHTQLHFPFPPLPTKIVSSSLFSSRW